MIPKKNSPPTQAAIANAVGISRASVSHILSGRNADRYQVETRRKVLAEAEALGYRPHRAAQFMRTGKSNLIGVIHFGTGHHNARQASHYLPQAINAAGYETFVVDMSWHGDCHRRALELLIEARVEGVIISFGVESFGVDDVQMLTQAGIPVVTLAGNEKLGIPIFLGDVQLAFRDLTWHLAGLGHRTLMLLTSDCEARPTMSRIAGFEEGLRTLEGVTGEIVRLPRDRGGFDLDAQAYEFVKKLIADKALPDAILASNDQWARGVFAAALEAGLRIPQDLAVTGADNEPFAARAPFYFTTTALDVGQESQKAVEVLLEMIQGGTIPTTPFVFPCRLVIRNSCGAQISSPALTSTTETHDHVMVK